MMSALVRVVAFWQTKSILWRRIRVYAARHCRRRQLLLVKQGKHRRLLVEVSREGGGGGGSASSACWGLRFERSVKGPRRDEGSSLYTASRKHRSGATSARPRYVCRERQTDIIGV